MSQTNFSLSHIIRESNIKDGTAPLLVMLHGYGSDENDLFSFASELPEKLLRSGLLRLDGAMVDTRPIPPGVPCSTRGMFHLQMYSP